VAPRITAGKLARIGASNDDGAFEPIEGLSAALDQLDLREPIARCRTKERADFAVDPLNAATVGGLGDARARTRPLPRPEDRRPSIARRVALEGNAPKSPLTVLFNSIAQFAVIALVYPLAQRH
jgi:hypothetical protein